MKQYKYTIDGKKYEVTIAEIKDNVASLTVNGVDYKVEMEPQKEEEKPKPVVHHAALAQPSQAQEEAAAKKASLRDAIKAPLPGVITEIRVSVGDSVKAGDVCVVLEAMKMANNLEAEKSGKVTAVYVQTGQSVMEGEPLVNIQ